MVEDMAFSAGRAPCQVVMLFADASTSAPALPKTISIRMRCFRITAMFSAKRALTTNCAPWMLPGVNSGGPATLASRWRGSIQSRSNVWRKACSMFPLNRRNG